MQFFLSDLLRNFFSDNSQFLKGCASLFLVNLGDFVSGDYNVADSRSFDSLSDSFGSLVVDVVSNFLKAVLDSFFSDLQSNMSNLLLFLRSELVGMSGFLGKFLSNSIGFLVNLSLELFDNLLDHLFVGLDVSRDVLGDDTVRYHVALVSNLHAALRHKDGFFGS